MTNPVYAVFKTASGRVLSLADTAVADDTETEILSGGVNQNNQVGVNLGQYGVNETIVSGMVNTPSGAYTMTAWIESPSGNVLQPVPVSSMGPFQGNLPLCAPLRLMTGMSLKVIVTETQSGGSGAFAAFYSPTKSDIFQIGASALGTGVEQELVSVKTGQSIGNSMVGARITKAYAMGNVASGGGGASVYWPFAYVKSSEGYVKESIGLTMLGSDDISGLDGVRTQTLFSDVNYLVGQNDKLYMTI